MDKFEEAGGALVIKDEDFQFHSAVNPEILMWMLASKQEKWVETVYLSFEMSLQNFKIFLYQSGV